MTRSHLRHNIKDAAGNVIQNAKCYVYEAGTTTAATDVFLASSGGSAVSGGTLTSNAQGEIEAWLTTARTVDIKVTDNASAAYYPHSPGTPLEFADFTETVEVHLPPGDDGLGRWVTTDGADPLGVSDSRAALALADAATTSQLFFPPGTYLVNSNITISSQCVFAEGAKIKPASGVTVTLAGSIDAGWFQIFDISSGGVVNLSSPKVEKVAPQWYGALADGVTDDSAAIQAALNYALFYDRGTVYFPPGTYMVGTTLKAWRAFGQATGWRMTGAGGTPHQQTGKPRLIYTAATGELLQVWSTYGWEIDHLTFSHNNASYTGRLVDVGWGTPGGSRTDPQVFHIHHCAFSAEVSSSAQAGLRLDRAIIGEVSHCHFGRFKEALELGTSGTYVVGVSINNNTFNFYQDAGISFRTGDGESITVGPANVFETPSGVAGCASIRGFSGNALYNLAVRDNWFGDNAVSTASWISGLNSNNYLCTIENNRMASIGLYHVNNTGGPWKVAGNTMETATAIFGPSCTGRWLIDFNFFNNTGTPIWASTRPTAVWARGNLSVGGGNPLFDTHPSRLIFGGRDEASAPYIDVGSTGEQDKGQLVIGQASAVVAPSKTNRAAIYTVQSGSDPARLVLQAPCDADVRSVDLVAGTTPTPVIRVLGGQIGFFNTGAASRQTVTGSRGGNAALASLLSALAAYGLIIDSSS